MIPVQIDRFSGTGGSVGSVLGGYVGMGTVVKQSMVVVARRVTDGRIGVVVKLPPAE